MVLSPARALLLAASSLFIPASPLLGQAISSGSTRVASPDRTDEVPEWMKRLAIDPESSTARLYADQQKARVAAEKSLRKIRAKYFGPVKNTQVRQEGIVQLREFTDPALFPSMVDVFDREGADVRVALLDHFQDSNTPAGDASLAWVAIFDRDAEVRQSATTRVQTRMKAVGAIPNPVRYAVFEGMKAGEVKKAASAARFASDISMYDAIPWMIARLVTGQPASAPQTQTAGFGNSGRNGALAWIMVGQQTAFVSDLTPVVSNNAVAFDPQLSVVTEGVILRVMDAHVVTYHVDIFNILNDFADREMGEGSTKELGWNVPAWREWYATTFLPEMKRREAAKAAEPKSVNPG